MNAIRKMEAMTLKEVHALAAGLRPGLALETVYRWRAALKSGRGIPDPNKRLLIEATRETPHPIGWLDFTPEAEHGPA